MFYPWVIALIVVGVILLILFGLCISSTMACRAFKIRCEKVKIGMKKDQVIAVMGVPNFEKPLENGTYKCAYVKKGLTCLALGSKKILSMEISYDEKEEVVSIRKDNTRIKNWL